MRRCEVCFAPLPAWEDAYLWPCAHGGLTVCADCFDTLVGGLSRPWAGGSCAVFLRGVDGGDPDFFQLRAFAERLCIFPEKKNTDRPEGQSVFLVGEDGFPPSEDKLRLHLPRKEKYQSPKKGNWYFWWGKMDSNHRRHCQQIYSLSPLATREFPHMQFCQKVELVDGLEPPTC